MKIKKKITYWFSVIAIGIALGLVLQFVRAWTEPGAPPPSGNLGAPINTSAIEQTEYGPLNIYGSDHGIWTTGSNYGIAGNDSDNSTWGVLGYGGWGGAFGGPVNSNSFMQAVSFLDDDPNYYIDSNSESKMNKLNISRSGGGAFNSDTTLSLAEDTIGTGKKAGINFHNGGVAEGQLNLDSGTNGRELKAYSYQTDMDLHATGIVQGDQGLCIGGDCRSSWPSFSDNLQVVTNRGWTTSQPLYSSNYVQAPHFYDADNAGFYLNPNGGSRLNNVSVDDVCLASNPSKCLSNPAPAPQPAQHGLYGTCMETYTSGACQSVSGTRCDSAYSPAYCTGGSGNWGSCACDGGYTLVLTGSSTNYTMCGEPITGLQVLGDTKYYSCYKN